MAALPGALFRESREKLSATKSLVVESPCYRPFVRSVITVLSLFAECDGNEEIQAVQVAAVVCNVRPAPGKREGFVKSAKIFRG